MPSSDGWFTFRRVAANGRAEVACRATDDHLFWLAEDEIANWTVCPHCVGWISHWPPADTPVAVVPWPG
jgi:hypothetical protein